MKNYILFIFLLIANFTMAQSFNGVAISGSSSNAIAQFKAKGFRVTDASMQGATIMKGNIGIEPVEIFIFETPKTKQVFKISIYFQEEKTWPSIKKTYTRYLETLSNKYGQPDYTYASFTNPYYEGDGYEMSAVELEKCDYSSVWLNKDNTNISVEISKYKQVKIIYENVINIALYKKERDALNQNIF